MRRRSKLHMLVPSVVAPTSCASSFVPDAGSNTTSHTYRALKLPSMHKELSRMAPIRPRVPQLRYGRFPPCGSCQERSWKVVRSTLSKRQWIIVTENVCLTCPSVIARPHVDGILFGDSETKLRIQVPARCFRCHQECRTPSS
jgi:hypothetical protein